MITDRGVIAERIKHARELQGLSCAVVSLATGISEGRLIEIEAGSSEPSGDEVLILAFHYRHDFRDFVDDRRPEPFDSVDILYRRSGSAFSPSDRRAVQEFLFLCERESEIEKVLEVQRTSFSFVPSGEIYKKHGEDAAIALRKSLRYKNNEIVNDVYADMRKIGVHVFRRRLDSSAISGLFVNSSISGRCVLINYDEDIYRQRFSAAHELAHSIFDVSDSARVTFDTRSNAYDKADLKEIRANRFASCLLLPPSSLPKGVVWTSSEAVRWASSFRVSTAVLAISLRESALINDSEYQVICSAKVPSGLKVDPEAPKSLTEAQRKRRFAYLERGLSDHYVRLCFEAHHEGHVSSGWLSESFLADHAELREISVLFGGSLRYEF